MGSVWQMFPVHLLTVGGAAGQSGRNAQGPVGEECNPACVCATIQR